MANWSDLPYDVLVVIAESLTKLEDFISFRGVCKSWSAAARKEYFKGLWLWQDMPYLMLPVRDGNDDVRELYSLIEGEIVASVKVPNFKSRKCLESLGWLLAVEGDGSMCLIDPFSGVEIPLPHQTTFPEYETYEMDEHVFIQKMVLSDRPSETSDFILMILGGGCSQLAFWRLGDESWNRIGTSMYEHLFPFREGGYTDVVYQDRKFYATGNAGFVKVFDFAAENPPKGRIITRLIVDVANNLYKSNMHNELVSSKILYILKAFGSLLLITRKAEEWNEETDKIYYETSKFGVYEINMSSGTWREINSLGSMAVFIGHNSTMAVDASTFSGVIKPNHIYFTDDGWEYYYFDEDKGGGKDMGVYNLETGAIEPIYDGELLLSKISPSIWITPFF